MTVKSHFVFSSNLAFYVYRYFCCGEIVVVIQNVRFLCRCSAKSRHLSAVRHSQLIQVWSVHVTYSVVLARHKGPGYTS